MLKRNAIAPTLLLALATLSLAQTAAAEMAGFYANAELGYVVPHIHTTDLINISNANTPVGLPGLNDYLLAYRLGFGYQFDPHWAMEFGYRHFSHNNISTGTNNYNASASTKENAFDFVGKAIVPVSAKLNLYAKLGVAYLRPNAQGSSAFTNNPYTVFANSYSNTLEPTFGLGISYALNPNVPIELSWNRIQKLGGSNHAPSSDFYSLGVSYYFG
jgi:opacity protein-like surface antigen